LTIAASLGTGTRSNGAMDWNRIEGNWKQFKGRAKEKWGRLTDDVPSCSHVALLISPPATRRHWRRHHLCQRVKTGRSKGDTHAAQSLADQRASAGVCRQRRPCRRATATSTGRPA